jgi:hypothetical protein
MVTTPDKSLNYTMLKDAVEVLGDLEDVEASRDGKV